MEIEKKEKRYAEKGETDFCLELKHIKDMLIHYNNRR